MIYQQLTESEKPLLSDFLSQHIDQSMFLLSNLREAGLYHSQSKQNCQNGQDGIYYGAITPAGALQSVMAHFRNGTWAICSPDPKDIAPLSNMLQQDSRFPMTLVAGPHQEVIACLSACQIEQSKCRKILVETLFTLPLDHLIIPEKASDYQLITAADMPAQLLFDWLAEYECDTLGKHPGPELNTHIWQRVSRLQTKQVGWGLYQDDQCLALAGFNAKVAEAVQIGPVWTPPAHRGQGFARILVAKILYQARLQQIPKAILFTDNPAAISAYQAIGFKPSGTYCLAYLS